MEKTILAFGDSNTYGMPPMTNLLETERFDAQARWPQVMHRIVGGTLLEEGLPGRSASAVSDALMGPHMNGQIGLRIALESHGPIDILVIMLGTNDVKCHLGLTPEAVAGSVAGLLAIANNPEYQDRHGGFQTLLVCPPPVKEIGVLRELFFGAAAKSAALPPLYAELAAVWGAGFLDAGQHIETSDIDGVHFEAEAQIKLGQAIGAYLAQTAGASLPGQ